MSEYERRQEFFFTEGAEPYRRAVQLFRSASRSALNELGLQDCAVVFYDVTTETKPDYAYPDVNFVPDGYTSSDGEHIETAIFVALPQSSETANEGLWREVRRAQSATTGRRKKNREPRFNRFLSNDRVQRFGAAALWAGLVDSAVSGILLSSNTGNTAIDAISLFGGAGIAFAGEEMINHSDKILKRFDPRERSYRRFARRAVSEGKTPINIHLRRSY